MKFKTKKKKGKKLRFKSKPRPDGYTVKRITWRSEFRDKPKKEVLYLHEFGRSHWWTHDLDEAVTMPKGHIKWLIEKGFGDTYQCRHKQPKYRDKLIVVPTGRKADSGLVIRPVDVGPANTNGTERKQGRKRRTDVGIKVRGRLRLFR